MHYFYHIKANVMIAHIQVYLESNMLPNVHYST